MHAWCLVSTILHQSVVIQGNSVGVLFNGLLAGLHTLIFFTMQYHKGWLVAGGGESQSGGEPRSGGESTHCVVTLVSWIHRCWKWPKKLLNQ